MRSILTLSVLSAMVALGTSCVDAALVVHYTLDDDGGGLVSSTNSGSSLHSWNSTTGATLTTGKFGGAGAFTTNSQWWSNSDTTANLQGFTLSMHIQTNNSLNWQDFASIGDNNNSVFRLEYAGNDHGIDVYSTGTPGGTAINFAGSGPDIGDGNWHHAALVSNGATIELFVDGSSAGSTAYTGTGDIDAFQLVKIFGGGNPPGARSQNANIDDIAIYDTALNSSQITWLSSNEAIANPIPEPAVALLGGLGLLGLLRRRRA